MIAYLSQYLGDFCGSDFCFVDFFSGLWLWDSLGCWLLYSGHELHRLPFGQQAGQDPLRLLDFPLLHTAQLTGSPGYILSEGHHLSLGFFLFLWFPTLWPSFIAPPFFPWIHIQEKNVNQFCPNSRSKRLYKRKWSKPGCLQSLQCKTSTRSCYCQPWMSSVQKKEELRKTERERKKGGREESKGGRERSMKKMEEK